MRLLVVFLTFFITGTAYADANCSFIHDLDMQNLCRAKTRQSLSYCSFIRNRDMENYCKAVVGNNRSYCSFIRNHDVQNMCKAEVR